jgi:DNA invertase Pin-like site-specific DNA recombinase
MRRIAYLRVSTAEQRPDRQIDGLKELSDELHVETVSAISQRRPIYDRVTAALNPGDTFVIWDLDRAYRSAKDALNQLDTLRERGVDFHIANFNLDTRTPTGRFVYTVMGGLAEFERATLVQRTKEGMAAARERGARIGRPPRLTDEELFDVRRRLLVDSTTIKQIAYEYGLAPWSLSRAIRRAVARSPATDTHRET